MIISYSAFFSLYYLNCFNFISYYSVWFVFTTNHCHLTLWPILSIIILRRIDPSCEHTCQLTENSILTILLLLLSILILTESLRLWRSNLTKSIHKGVVQIITIIRLTMRLLEYTCWRSYWWFCKYIIIIEQIIQNSLQINNFID